MTGVEMCQRRRTIREPLTRYTRPLGVVEAASFLKDHSYSCSYRLVCERDSMYLCGTASISVPDTSVSSGSFRYLYPTLQQVCQAHQTIRRVFVYPTDHYLGGFGRNSFSQAVCNIILYFDRTYYEPCVTSCSIYMPYLRRTKSEATSFRECVYVAHQ